MKSFESIRNHSAQMKALTTLSSEEFEMLLPDFEYYASLLSESCNRDGQVRLRKHTFRKNSTFKSYAEMLFFILKPIACNTPLRLFGG
jgi:hypothetical protein